MKARNWLLLGVLVVANGCGGDSSAPDERPAIVATTTILGDVVANIVGNEAHLDVLMPVGADPHDFRASAAQVATINQADLVIANGLGLEEGMADVLDAAADDGVRIVWIAPLLQPLPFAGHNEESHEGEDHDEDEPLDPHVWLDPLRMATAARLIAGELAAIDPDVDWSSMAEVYVNRLAAADADIAAILDPIPTDNRRLVTNHDSLGYFADRYGFEVVGVVIPGGSTLADPSSQELARLVTVMEQEGVTAIYAETTQPRALAEAVAAELGGAVQVVSLYTGSLGEPGSDADTLIGLLTTNARLIAAASGG